MEKYFIGGDNPGLSIQNNGRDDFRSINAKKTIPYF